MGNQDLLALIKSRNRDMAERLNKEIEDWKHSISVYEKLLEDTTRMFEKYGDEIFRKCMEWDAEEIAFCKKMLAEDMKLLETCASEQ